MPYFLGGRFRERVDYGVRVENFKGTMGVWEGVDMQVGCRLRIPPASGDLMILCIYIYIYIYIYNLIIIMLFDSESCKIVYTCLCVYIYIYMALLYNSVTYLLS